MDRWINRQTDRITMISNMIIFSLLVSGQTLTPSLQKYVEDSNKAFDNEVMVYNLKKQRAQSKGKELIKPVKSVRFVPPGTTLPGTASNNSEMIALASDAKRARAESPPPEDMQVM